MLSRITGYSGSVHDRTQANVGSPPQYANPDAIRLPSPVADVLLVRSATRSCSFRSTSSPTRQSDQGWERVWTALFNVVMTGAVPMPVTFWFGGCRNETTQLLRCLTRVRAGMRRP